MIESFADTASEDIFNGLNTREARKACPKSLWRIAVRKLDQLDSADNIEELRVPPDNRLEVLSGNREGQFSIRINELVNQKRGVTPSTALRLARFFDMSADFWLNLQVRWDLYRA